MASFFSFSVLNCGGMNILLSVGMMRKKVVTFQSVFLYMHIKLETSNTHISSFRFLKLFFLSQSSLLHAPIYPSHSHYNMYAAYIAYEASLIVYYNIHVNPETGIKSSADRT